MSNSHALKRKGKDKSECISKWWIVRFSLSLEQSKYRGVLWGISNKYKTIFLHFPKTIS